LTLAREIGSRYTCSFHVTSQRSEFEGADVVNTYVMHSDMRGQNSITQTNKYTSSVVDRNTRTVQLCLNCGVPVVNKRVTAVRHNTTSAVIDEQTSQRSHRYRTAVSLITTHCSKISSSCLRSSHALDQFPRTRRNLSQR